MGFYITLTYITTYSKGDTVQEDHKTLPTWLLFTSTTTPHNFMWRGALPHNYGFTV